MGFSENVLQNSNFNREDHDRPWNFTGSPHLFAKPRAHMAHMAHVCHEERLWYTGDLVIPPSIKILYISLLVGGAITILKNMNMSSSMVGG